MRALILPSVPTNPRRPLRMAWTVIAGQPTTPRLAAQWVVETDTAPAARAA